MVEPYVSLAERQQQRQAAHRALRERFLQRRRRPAQRPSVLEDPPEDQVPPPHLGNPREWRIMPWQETVAWDSTNGYYSAANNHLSLYEERYLQTQTTTSNSSTWTAQILWCEEENRWADAYAERRRFWREIRREDDNHHWSYVPVRRPERRGHFIEFQQRAEVMEDRRHLDAMIDEVGRRERHSIEVQGRAWALLKEHLAPEQLRMLDDAGEFVVTSLHGRRYLIRTHHYEHNVFLLDERGEAIEELCVRIGETGMPLADHLLAQVLGLRFNEDWLRNIANITPLNGHRYRSRIALNA